MFVVMPAAGSSSRFGDSTPKQFLQVGDKTVIEHALDPFLQHPLIKKIMVVLSMPCVYWDILPLAKHVKISLADGGDQRADSVLNGLIELSADAKDDDWVLVHDAARPCFTTEMLDKLITELSDHPTGGIMALPVRDTLKKVTDHDVVTMERDQLWQAQTPQMFRYGKLIGALAKNLDVTDEAQALEKMGEQIKLVRGDLRNFKVTHESDLGLVKQILRGEHD